MLLSPRIPCSCTVASHLPSEKGSPQGERTGRTTKTETRIVAAKTKAAKTELAIGRHCKSWVFLACAPTSKVEEKGSGSTEDWWFGENDPVPGLVVKLCSTPTELRDSDGLVRNGDDNAGRLWLTLRFLTPYLVTLPSYSFNQT